MGTHIFTFSAKYLHSLAVRPLNCKLIPTLNKCNFIFCILIGVIKQTEIVGMYARLFFVFVHLLVNMAAKREFTITMSM